MKKYKKKPKKLVPKEKIQVPHIWIGGVEKKSCGGCGKLKSLTEFKEFLPNPDRLTDFCLDCIGNAVEVKREQREARVKPRAKADAEDRERARMRLLRIKEEQEKREKARKEASEETRRRAVKAMVAREVALKGLAERVGSGRHWQVPARCLSCFWGGKRFESDMDVVCPKCGSKLIFGRRIEEKELP